MPIDTLANVRTALLAPPADDPLLELLRPAAEDFIVRHTGRAFDGGTHTEVHPGGGTLLFLAGYPVAAVTGVWADPARGFGPGTEVDPGRYVVHAGRGVVESVAGPWVAGGCGRTRADAFPGAVRVTYTTPPDPAPAAVRQAYADLVGFWYRQAKTFAATGQQHLTGRYVDGAQLSYSWDVANKMEVPAAVLRLLAPFRVPAA